MGGKRASDDGAAAASFAAGILGHAPAIVAVTAPSAVSHEPLKPHSLPTPTLSEGDRGGFSAEERAVRGIGELPHGMGDALEADAAATGRLGPELSRADLMLKRGDLRMAAEMDIDERCRTSSEIYRASGAWILISRTRDSGYAPVNGTLRAAPTATPGPRPRA